MRAIPMPSTLPAWRPAASLLAASAALFLAACAHAPEAPPTPAPLQAHFAGEASLRAVATTTPDVSLDTWWLAFKDPQLTALVQRALAQNLDLRMALARVEQAEAAARAADARRMPQAAVDARVLRQRQSLLSPEGRLASAFPGYERSQTIEAGGVGVTWEADLADGLRGSAVAASAEWQAAEALGTGVRVSLVAEVATAYFRMRGAEERMAVAEEQVRIRQHLQGLIQDRFSHGMAVQRDVADAQAAVLQARGVLPELRIEQAAQLNRLAILTGAQAGTLAIEPRTAALAGVLPQLSLPGLPADITPTQMLRRRPDVIAAERALDASQARVGVAEAEYYPRLTLGGLLGADSMKGQLFTSAAFQPQAYVGLHWRLFDFGRVDAEVAAAKGAREEALAQVRLRMLRATEDVENALSAMVELEARRQDLEREAGARQAARDAAEEAYKGGEASLLDVLVEDRLLAVTKDDWARLQARRAEAAVMAFRAFGGGWAASS